MKSERDADDGEAEDESAQRVLEEDHQSTAQDHPEDIQNKSHDSARYVSPPESLQ